MPKRPPRTPDLERRQRLLGQRLRSVRLQAGLTVNEVVQMLGPGYPGTRVWLSEIEHGRNGIDALTLQRLSEVLDVPIAYFTDMDYDQSRPKWPKTRGEWVMLASGDMELGHAVWDSLRRQGLIRTYPSQ